MRILTVQPDYGTALETAGLASFDALFAAGETGRIDGHWQRSVSRLELQGPDGLPLVIYLKRQWGRAAQGSWREVLRLHRPGWPARREWENTLRLRSAGIDVAEPVALGLSDDGGRPRSLVAYREVPGQSLLHLADAWPQAVQIGQDARRWHRVARAVGEAVRRLHVSGFSFPDLYAKHVFVDAGADRPSRVVLIDVHRLRGASRRRAAADLAALYDTTRLAGVRQTDRVRFLRTYLGVDRLGTDARRLAGEVLRRASRASGRGRDPNLAESHRVAPPGMVPLSQEEIVDRDAGRVQVNRAFLASLGPAGLTTLDGMMAFEGGEPYREAPGRRTVRVELADPSGGIRTVYLKRHDRVPLRTRLRRFVSLGEPVSAAKREVQNIVRVMGVGIPTARWVALGEAFEPGGWRERSCLVTEEIAGATQADDWAQASFGEDASAAATASKRRMVRALGRLARRFHAAGFVHKDFYLCHVMVRPVEGGETQLHLIDLQRVVRYPRRARSRWIVKDLAALLFSSWPSEATGIRTHVFSNTDRLRFAHEYFGVARLAAQQKRLIGRIVRKARRIARHEARRRARRRP